MTKQRTEDATLHTAHCTPRLSLRTPTRTHTRTHTHTHTHIHTHTIRPCRPRTLIARVGNIVERMLSVGTIAVVLGTPAAAVIAAAIITAGRWLGMTEDDE